MGIVKCAVLDLVCVVNGGVDVVDSVSVLIQWMRYEDVYGLEALPRYQPLLHARVFRSA